VPWIARPFYHLARGRFGTWNPVTLGLLVADSLFVAATAVLTVVLGTRTLGSYPVSLVASLLYLLNFCVPNVRLVRCRGRILPADSSVELVGSRVVGAPGDPGAGSIDEGIVHSVQPRLHGGVVDCPSQHAGFADAELSLDYDQLAAGLAGVDRPPVVDQGPLGKSCRVWRDAASKSRVPPALRVVTLGLQLLVHIRVVAADGDS
jgi:hypothetical protein